MAAKNAHNARTACGAKRKVRIDATMTQARDPLTLCDQGCAYRVVCSVQQMVVNVETGLGTTVVEVIYN